MWFYNDKLQKWFHSSGVQSSNPKDREPTPDELAALTLERQAILEARKLAPQPEAKPPNNDCGCNKGGNRAAR
jgi:hypothetical protein